MTPKKAKKKIKRVKGFAVIRKNGTLDNWGSDDIGFAVIRLKKYADKHALTSRKK